MCGRPAFGQGHRAGEAGRSQGSGPSGTLTVLAEAPAFVLLAGCTAFLYTRERDMPVWACLATGLFVMTFLAFSGTVSSCPRFTVILLFLTGVFFIFGVTAGIRLEKPVPEAQIWLESKGTVVTERSWGNRRAVVIKTSKGKFLCKLPSARLFREGDRVSLEGKIRYFDPAPSSREFDEDSYWKARGVLGSIQDPDLVKEGRDWLTFSAWRSFLKERILLSIPQRTRGYILASWLGTRDPDLSEKHRKWGTSHILAISGFHVGIVALGLRRITRRRVLAPSIFMWGYVLLSGGAASALRAALMFQTAFLGDLLGRPGRAVNAVSAAAVMILLWRPWWFWDLGWRLSVTAALVLGSIASTREWRRFWAGIPIVWYVTGAFISRSFGSVPVAGMIMNIFAVPLFGFLLPAMSLIVLPGLCGIPGAGILLRIMEMLLWSLHCCAQGLSLMIPFQAGFGFFPVIPVCAMLVYLPLRGAGITRSRSAYAGVFSALFAGILF